MDELSEASELSQSAVYADLSSNYLIETNLTLTYGKIFGPQTYYELYLNRA